MSAVPGTNVAAPVVPFTTEDSYPTHDAAYGKGGWREAASTAERDAIPLGRQRVGMIVNVVGDQAYELTETGAPPIWKPYTVPTGQAQIAAIRRAVFLEA